MKSLFCDLINVISEVFTTIFYDDSGKFSIFTGCLLAFSGVMLLLIIILKVFKIFSLHCKNDLSLEENLDSKKNDIKYNFKDTSVFVSSHKVPLGSRFSCDYCGSISTSDYYNCRNCGSNDFTKIK